MYSVIHSLSAIQIVLYTVLLVVIAYFGLANSLVQLLCYFRFYRRFHGQMAAQNIYTDPAYAGLGTGRLVGCLLGLGLCGFATVFAAVRLGVVGVLSAAAAFGFGIMLYGKKLKSELWNLQRFVKQYSPYLDKDRLARYLRGEYDLSLEQLADTRLILEREQRKKGSRLS